MADIFISYASEDRERAKGIAQALEQQDWSVWWDRVIPPGKQWADVIEAEINAARCVVVLWSRVSVKGDWVRKEARAGNRRRILVPALIEPADIPFEFEDIQAADLTGWSGDVSHLEFRKLCASIAEHAGPPPAEARARETAEARAREEAETRARAGAERRARAEAEARAKAEAEARERREKEAQEARRREKEALEKAERDAKAKAEAEEQARAREQEQQRIRAEAQRREDLTAPGSQEPPAASPPGETTRGSGGKWLAGGVVGALVLVAIFAVLDQANEAKQRAWEERVAREREAELRADAERKAAESLAQAQAEREARLKGEREAKARADAEAAARAREAEVRAQEEKKAAEARARADAEARAKADTLSPGRVFGDCDVCPEMVVVPAGSFDMGSRETEKGRSKDEGPRQGVTIVKPFALGRFEVTVAQFRRFVDATGYRTEAENDAANGCATWGDSDKKWVYRAGKSWRGPGFSQGDDDPVVCVSWNDATKYVEWLSKKAGKPYRLPSEAEWEYAARAGTKTARYWGDDPNQACRYANVADRRAGAKHPDWVVHDCDDGYAETAPVGRFQENRFKLHDMLGNAWELTEDCWNESYAGAPKDGSAWRGGDCGRRLVRGGAWYDKPDDVRSANRGRLDTSDRDSVTGFRLARTLD